MTAPGAPAPRIAGVVVRPLHVFRDDRGAVMRMLRASDPHFEQFGEIYFSLVGHGCVKAWHRHRAMTLNYAVPIGSIRLVIVDDRAESPTLGHIDELQTGADHYALITIPPGVWSGFAGTAAGDSIVANCATMPHAEDEIERRPHDDASIPYRW